MEYQHLLQQIACYIQTIMASTPTTITLAYIFVSEDNSDHLKDDVLEDLFQNKQVRISNR